MHGQQNIEKTVFKVLSQKTEPISWAIKASLLVTVKVKVKCTLVQALRLCTGRTAHRGCVEVLLYSFLTTALEGVRDQLHASAALYPGKDPVSTVQDAAWAPGPVWTGAEHLAQNRTIQAVAIRYTNWATVPTLVMTSNRFILPLF